MKISKITLRTNFRKGLKPLQDTFYNWFDSYWHKDELIPIEAVDDLQTILNAKLDNSAQDTLINAFNTALDESAQMYGSGIHPKPLKISDPTPTVQGGYVLADVGTYSFGTTTSGNLNIGYLSSDGWEIVSVSIEGSGNPESSGELISFSENIYFDKQSISVASVNSPIIFKPYGTNARLLGSTLVRLIADGINVPDFSNFKKFNGSQDYVNINGTLNVVFFFFDGFDAWYNMWQGVGSSNIDFSDVTAPTAPTLSVGTITTDSIELIWSGATDNTAVTAYEIYKDNILINTVSASPFVISGLTGSTLYSFKIKAKDAAGNLSAFSNITNVTTAIYIISNIEFNNLSGAIYNSSANTLTSNSADTGGKSSTPIIGDFELFTNSPLTSASVIMLKSDLNGGFQWTAPSNVNYLIACYIFDDKLTITTNSNNLPAIASISTSDTFLKMVRLGINCLIYSSSNGSTWTLRHTQTGIFSNISDLYIQGNFAVTQSNSISLRKSQ